MNFNKQTVCRLSTGIKISRFSRLAFREDDSRARIGNAAANLGIVRHIALVLRA